MTKRLQFMFLFLALAYPVAAQRSTIGVTVEIASNHPYGTKFQPADRAWIVNEVQKEVITAFKNAFPPFDFEASAPQVHLKIVLDFDPLATSINRAVDFFLAVDPEHFPQRDRMVVEYRSAENSGLPVPERDIFAAELAQVLTARITNHPNDFVTQLLTWVPVASSAQPVTAQKIFVMPFKAAELKVGKSTLFRIEANDNDSLPCTFSARAAGDAPATLTVPSPYRRKLRAQAQTPVDPDNSLTRFAHGESFTPTGVFLKYYDLYQEAQPIPATGFTPGRTTP